jgi:hypothetical protein
MWFQSHSQAKQRQKYDVQAMGALACRHYIVLDAWWYTTGETYGPYLDALEKLARNALEANVLISGSKPSDPCTICIDIACRFEQFVEKRFDSVSDPIKNMCFRTGKLHGPTHSVACQLFSLCTFQKGAGNFSGENMETIFAQVCKGHNIAKYLTLPNFFAYYDQRLLHWNRQVRDRLATQLIESARRAVQQRNQALAALPALAVAAGYDEEQCQDSARLGMSLPYNVVC